MIRHEPNIEELSEARLRPRQVPPAETAWWSIRRTLAAEPHRRRLRLLRVAAAALVLLVLSAGLALASPDLRAWFGGVGVSLSGSSRGVASLEPAPPFTVLQPDLATLPGGWLVLANGYNPGPAPSGAPGWSGTSGAAPSASGVTVARRVGSQDLVPTTSELAQARAQDLLGRANEATLVLVCQDPSGQLVQVRERAAAGKTLPSGEPITVHNQAGVIAQQGDQQVLTFVLEGTLVEISGNAPRAAMLALADALQPTTLRPFETTAAGQALAAATPPAWTRLPLSARLGPPVPASATRTEIAQQCAWDASAARLPPGQAMLQVHCAARLAAGVTNDQGGWGYDLSHWHDVANRLGLDATPGPAGDPQVYLVQLAVSEQGGWVVVLDAATAEPYLVAPLRPVP